MSKRIIEVLDYDPLWAEKFEQEKQLLSTALGGIVLNLEHIGSTSVVGLAAKAVIDMQLEVSSLQQLDRKTAVMETLGYVAKGENGIAGRRYFQKGGNQRSHHLHVFASGDEHLFKHRVFRNYLVAHPKALAAYAEVKRRAAMQCEQDSIVYMGLKNSFVQQHLTNAIAWEKSLVD